MRNEKEEGKEPPYTVFLLLSIPKRGKEKKNRSKNRGKEGRTGTV